jgi:hypothetical protein
MKKALIFLPDGVGLRNFAFTDFYKLGCEMGFDIQYWNHTIFPLKEAFGYNEIVIDYAKPHPLTDIYKRARKEIELKQNFKNFKDTAYLSYHFPPSYKGLKKALKNVMVEGLIALNNSEKGLGRIRSKINVLERRTAFYKKAKQQLEAYKPEVIFCTNQRALSAIAPILAARDLGIPTATFIFSWDNLPKGMMVVETDYYFVWSAYMKNELLQYYPFIEDAQIKIVGTPQFTPHFEVENFETKKDFFKKYALDINKKYICFSGDDITTSPFDQYYLEDLAETVKTLNKTGGQNLGIIYRKCPVDFTDRHQAVFEKYKDIITCIDPLWKNLGNGWNHVMPTPEDTKLLVNTVKYSELVINVGSSMAFDAVSHQVPCAYLNYNTEKGDTSQWNIDKIYKYIHFKSMPSKEAVLWIHKKEDFKTVITKVLNQDVSLEVTQQWFDKISKAPQQDASTRIWKAIESIL